MARIALQGAVNVRDLGGIATASGQRLVSGQLIRGDSLSRLTDADVDLLGLLSLRTVIDFRSLPEASHLGPDRLPPGADAVDLPVQAADLDHIVRHLGNIGALRELLGFGKAAEFMRRVNREFVADDTQREQFARALRLIAADDARPVLFHCTAGKDRTGWMTAVLLTTLGVPREAIMADYLATNDYIWPAYSRRLGLLGEGAALVRQAELAVFKPLLVQDPGYLEAAFDEVKSRYGAFDDFLADGLGFGPADVSQLRSALLT